MAPNRRRLLAAIAASASIAGCVSDGGSGGDTDGDDTGDGGTNDGSTEADATGDGGGSDGGSSDDDGGMDGSSITIETSSHDQFGEILVDGQGMTLYMFDSDTRGSGSSTCSGGCADNWPPLTGDDGAMAGSNVEAELTTLDREDGSTQVAASGWPLYYWQGDADPGDATGQGVNDVWWVLDPSGEPIRPSGESAEDSSGSDDSPGY